MKKTMRRTIETVGKHENARRRWAAGDTRRNPRLGFQPSQILRAKATERKKRSRYSRGPAGAVTILARWRRSSPIERAVEPSGRGPIQFRQEIAQVERICEHAQAAVVAL